MKMKSRMDENMSAKEIFAEINKRQITAMMMHREFMVMFSFLGLQGFKRWQQYRYRDEAADNDKMNLYFIDHNNYMIPSLEVDAVHFIPSDWYGVNRLSVTPNVKKSYTNRIMLEWQEWESETKDVLAEYYSMLMENGEVTDAEFVGKLLCGTDKELKNLERCLEELNLVEFDPVYLAEIQKKMHDEYKEKMHMK